MKDVLFRADELAPGEVRAVTLGGRSIVVIRTQSGEYRALRNRCSHHGAPLSGGTLQPIVLGEDVGCYELAADRFMVRCPWHGYEFDVETGRCLADPEHERVRSYRVTVEEDMVVVHR